jgi:hypothetical protein
VDQLDDQQREQLQRLQHAARSRPLHIISMGAGVQSTALGLMAAEGLIHPLPDLAVFGDTQWEPAPVYDHLQRLTAALPFPLWRVTAGNIRQDLVSGTGKFAAIPYHTQRQPGPCQRCPDSSGVVMDDVLGERKCPRCKGTGWDDGKGLGRRQCTKEYKLEPVKRVLRVILGARPPQYRSVPRGRSAVQWVGFSTDEVGRANRTKDSHGVSYLDTRYPLLEADLDMSRTDCQRWLAARGWHPEKSACIGCPYHGNRQWRFLRDQRPDDWRDAVEVDAAIRKGAGGGATNLDGEAYLHRSRVPLSLAPIDHVTRAEWKDRQLTILDAASDAEHGLELDAEAEDGRYTACSPFGCDDGEPAA